MALTSGYSFCSMRLEELMAQAKVRRKRVIRLNSYDNSYYFSEPEFREEQNPIDGTYHLSGTNVLGYDEYNRKYVLKKNIDMCNKFNPYTGEYEYVPCHWELSFNPYTQRYEFAPLDD